MRVDEVYTYNYLNYISETQGNQDIYSQESEYNMQEETTQFEEVQSPLGNLIDIFA